MSIANEIIEGAQRAHSNLENNLKMDSLKCSFLYLSRKAHLTNSIIDEKIRRLLVKIGLILLSFGGGAYVISKYYPHETEIVVFVAFISCTIFYFFKKRLFLKSCTTVELSERPIWFYIKSLSLYISWTTTGKIILIDILLLFLGWASLLVVFSKEYFMLSSLIFVVNCFIAVSLTFMLFICYHKGTNK
ncbi:hypothetical protein ACVFI8_15505 [Agarivorans sp. MS3-6]